jgi:hypothetical protein
MSWFALNAATTRNVFRGVALLAAACAALLVAARGPTSGLKRQEPAPAAGDWKTITVESVADDGSAIHGRLRAAASSRQRFAVEDAELRKRAKSMRAGDVLHVQLAGAPDKLANFDVAATPAVEAQQVWMVLAASAAVLALLLTIFAGPVERLLVGEDGRYSKSKTQMFLWFGVLVTTYVAYLTLRWARLGPTFIGGIEIPGNLLLVSGLSALTFAGAKSITNARQAAKTRSATPRFFHDLTTDDAGRPDLADVQMLSIVTLAAVVYVARFAETLTVLEFRAAVKLPDLDTTLLAAFGLGQGAYLGKKLAGDDGAPKTGNPGGGGGGQPNPQGGQG